MVTYHIQEELFEARRELFFDLQLYSLPEMGVISLYQEAIVGI
jgi:hypothetical protein